MGQQWGAVADLCEHGDEPSGFHKIRKLHDQLIYNKTLHIDGLG
jgi:hypothetical protein